MKTRRRATHEASHADIYSLLAGKHLCSGVYSSFLLYIKNILSCCCFASFVNWVYVNGANICLVLLKKKKKKKKNKAKQMHNTPPVCCFYFAVLQCHTEYGENIFLVTNKSRQTVLLSVKINGAKRWHIFQHFSLHRRPTFSLSSARGSYSE